MFRSSMKRSFAASACRRFASSHAGSASNAWRRPAIIASSAFAGFAVYKLGSCMAYAQEPATSSLIEESDIVLPEINILDVVESDADGNVTEVTEIIEGKIEQAAEDEEDGAKGAYDPETGEINWDCPCLGGMADGPCGPEFKEAFSCFVYSEAEPKGVDCIEKFSAMQNCFREHPEVYAEELREENPLDAADAADGPVTTIPANDGVSPEIISPAEVDAKGSKN